MKKGFPEAVGPFVQALDKTLRGEAGLLWWYICRQPCTPCPQGQLPTNNMRLYMSKYINARNISAFLCAI